MLTFRCPQCGHTMKAAEQHAGRSTRCPKCGAAVTIPAESGPAAGPATRPAAGPGSRLGLLALLLVVVVALAAGAAWWFLGRPNGPAGGEFDDLALVPANARAVLSVRLAAAWQAPAMQKAMQEVRGMDFAQELEAETGVKPTDVERISFVVGDVGRQEGWAVVRTKAAYDSAAIWGRVRNGEEKSHLDRPYIVGQTVEGRPLAMAFVHPRGIVLGNEEGVRKALGLVGSPITRGPLAPVRALCEKEHHFAFGFAPEGGEGLRARLRALTSASWNRSNCSTAWPTCASNSRWNSGPRPQARTRPNRSPRR